MLLAWELSCLSCKLQSAKCNGILMRSLPCVLDKMPSNKCKVGCIVKVGYSSVYCDMIMKISDCLYYYLFTLKFYLYI